MTEVDQSSHAADDGMAVNQAASAGNSGKASLSASETAREIGRLLPRAVALSSRTGDTLAEALTPVVEQAFEISAEQHARPLIRALSRVLGAAVSRAALEFLRRIVLRLNLIVIRNFTARGLRWRLESLRSGQPFNEVVREHTTVQRIKQVFLIHRETGLLLEFAQGRNVEGLDGDMISSMLTAIQDFVHDSFGSRRSETLQTIRVGDTTVWVEEGEEAVLAGVVHGEASPQLRQTFHDVLAKIDHDFTQELRSFTGDTSVFAGARLYLESCVRSRVGESRERVLPFTMVLLAAPVVLLAVLGFLSIRRNLRWQAYLEASDDQPGLVVTDSGRQGLRWHIRGLRDPLAADPALLLEAHHLTPQRVVAEWTPFRSLDPAILKARVESHLPCPETVSLTAGKGALYITGTASPEWVDSVKRYVAILDAATSVDLTRLGETETGDAGIWRSYLDKLAATPGLVVVREGRNDEGFHLFGLRDPLAEDPDEILVDAGLTKEMVRCEWQLYQALTPAFVLTRARRMLRPPEDVTFELREGGLFIKGRATHRWISRATALAGGLAGIARIDTGDLVDVDMNELAPLRQGIENHVFCFLDQRNDLWPGQAKQLDTLIAGIKGACGVARRMRVVLTVEIRGHTSATRDEEANRTVSASLARRFLGILRRQDLDTCAFTILGMGSLPPDRGPGQGDLPACSRRVSFKVDVSEN